MGWQDAPIVKDTTTAPAVQPAWKSAPQVPQTSLVERVENQESRHNPNAYNPKSGAEGSMQTLPSTERDPGYGVAPAKDNSPGEKARVGRDYLEALRKKYGNDTLALAAYNWGPGHVDNLVAKTGGPARTGVENFMKHLPMETQNYITKISSDTSQPAWKKAPVVAQPSPAQPVTPQPPAIPLAPAPASPAPPQPAQPGVMDKLASVSDASTKAGANLISGAIAPFLSQKSLKILQDKGLYTPGESPLHEFSTAAYGTMMAPVSPLVNAAADKAKAAGNATIGQKATNTAGDLINTGMDVAGFALPGIKDAEPGYSKPTMFNAKGEAVTPTAIETKLAQLEKAHDAATSPAKQDKIKKQMMDVVNLHPEVANAAWKKAPLVDKPAAQSLPGEAAKGIKNVLNPTGAGSKAAKTADTIRAETGTANRNIAKGEAKLAQSYDTAASMTPEQQADYYQYVENRSKGATLADPGLQKIADDTKHVLEGVREEIESLPDGDKIGFYQDYFPHLFKRPEQARAFSNDFVSRQGSSGNLKARKYPTLADAQAAGLQLADSNPVKATSRYVNSMNNFIASKRIATQMIDKGDAKYYSPGRQPEGWQPLVGRFAERTRSYTKDIPDTTDVSAHAVHEKLYAPPEVARIYNNHYGRGVEGTDLGKPYELARTMTAMNTASELALSAYHYGTITGQLLATDVSRVIKNAAVGDWKGVAKGIKSTTAGQIPFVKGSAYKIGKDFIKQYKGLADNGLDMESIAEHFERGGGKLGQERLYRANQEGGLFTGRGGIKQSVRDIRDTFSEPGMTPKARAALDVFSRATEDVSYPLFEKYIPSVKTGAFANLMSDWIRQNPGASDTAIQAARKKYVDLVDDRFGEMNMDNVFWNKLLKQASSLFLRAQGWDIGLVRQAGGGVLDTVKILQNAFKGKKPPEALLDRPAFLASVIGTMALTSAAYQYMKTGQAPNEMLDYFAPKTGGTTPRGTAERTILPTAAHGRELLHIAAPMMSEGAMGTDSPLSGLAQEMSNKVASFPKNVMEAYENQDYTGAPIGNVTGPTGWVGSVPARLGHVASGFAPFGLTGQGDKLEGSNLSGTERRLFGMRPAGMEIGDPENYKRMRWTQEMKKEQKAEKAEMRRESEKAK